MNPGVTTYGLVMTLLTLLIIYHFYLIVRNLWQYEKVSTALFLVQPGVKRAFRVMLLGGMFYGTAATLSLFLGTADPFAAGTRYYHVLRWTGGIVGALALVYWQRRIAITTVPPAHRGDGLLWLYRFRPDAED